ncbi:MAG: hypothetical protein CMA31_00395 [Euryarchaeota archaeon]|nr:hypothetical protein [Euryarchaeota archaeon]|tara:strand:+ start:258 stop:1763 length:1506 start_codon:yes stop_codon:yes gene_type:complete
MAYTIDRYSGVTLVVVEDGTVDQTTDIKLVGKNYAGYGEIQNENFLHLLENFSGAAQPPKAISGQVWFDATASKLKFYDGTKFRTTGGAEVATTAPAGLATGDLWWDSANEQLYAFNGTGYVLIGPQGVGATVSQMVTKTVRDNTSVNRIIIAATVNDEVIFIISSVAFTIDSTDPTNAITGFDSIKKGTTLRNTINATGGVTSSTDYYWGTASNSLKLNGKTDTDFALAGSGAFTSLTTFADAGIAIGDSNDMKIYIENDNEGVIQNQVGTKIKFKVDDSLGAVKEPLTIDATGMFAPTTDTFSLGTSTLKFANVHATAFTGLASQAETLKVGANFRSADTAATNNTVAVRDGSGNLFANLFTGTATAAQYADLAEKYTTDKEYAFGTVVAVSGDASKELTECDVTNEAKDLGFIAPAPVGVISENPAYLMNSDADGQNVALKGRVPVRVTGPVDKGQSVFAGKTGTATTIIENGALIVGVALESNASASEKLVECILKV